METANNSRRPCLSPAVYLLLLIAVAVACFGGTVLLLMDLGPAFNEPCTAPGAALQEYTGCFSWTQWVESVAIVLLSFAFFAAASLSTTALVHTAAAPLAGCAQKACAHAAHLLLLLLMVGGAAGSTYYLAKPWATYQTDATGVTLPAANWTIDNWQVFLGGAMFAGCAPFAVALVAVSCNLCTFERDMARQRRVRAQGGGGHTSQSGEFDELAGERWGEGGGDELGEHLLASQQQQKATTGNLGGAGVPWGRLVGALVVLAVCLVATAVGSPIWNYSANSYFMMRSDFPWGNLSIGGQRPCSLGPNPTCDCGKDMCPWFSFHLYTDAVLYYTFLMIAVTVGAVAHNARCCLCARRPVGGPRSVVGCRCLPERLRCYPHGCSALEALFLVSMFGFFVFWFFFWFSIYGDFRFLKSDAAHECWMSENHTLIDDPAGRLCHDLQGSVFNNIGANITVLARTMGHMSSLSFAMTTLPVAKGSILLKAAGVSWEAALHWHRGLGAVAFVCVTAHMLLWWVKWAIDGSFVANFLNIDTNKWLWVSPTWQHYEDWSVLMAQIAWFFFLAMIIVAWTCRRKMYRLFYLSHHVGVAFLLFGLIHAWSFWYFILPGICLWWVDRMSRLVASARAVPVSRSKVVFASMDGGKNGVDITVLELHAPHIAKDFVPGQYALINVATVGRHEWHPFTINASAERPGESIVVCAKAMGAWTQRLRAAVAAHKVGGGNGGGGGGVGPVLVSGVYGGIAAHRFPACSDVVLVAGGIGITPVISVLRAALAARQQFEQRRPQSGSGGAAGDDAGEPGKLVLVWAVRSLSMLELPVVRAVLNAVEQLPAHGGVSARIHLTGPAGRRAAEAEAAAAAAAAAERGDNDGDGGGDEQQQATAEGLGRGGLPADAGALSYHACRPDLEKLFSSLPAASASQGGFAFACGPTALQAAVTEHAARFGFADVHTETFEF